MHEHILSAMILAAATDGQIDVEEVAVIGHIAKSSETFATMNRGALDIAIRETYQKICAGCSPSDIIKQISQGLPAKYTLLAYALAAEVCWSNHELDEREKMVLDMMKSEWGIPTPESDAILLSAKLRYAKVD
jgi:hypothetical protein